MNAGAQIAGPRPRHPFTIGACVDRGGIAGLEVLLRSLVSAHSAETRLELHVLHNHLPSRTIDRLSEIVHGSCASRVTWTSFEAERYFKGRVVFGLMSYARIFLPEIVTEGRVLYLDTDLVVNNSIEACGEIDLTECIAAVQEKTFGRSNCKTFFSRVGANLDSPYFNAGVLVIDCEKWTSERTRFQLIEAAERVGWDLPSGDQTLLNHHFQGRFDRLSGDWNCLAYAGASVSDFHETTKIVHFIGRPKPWECGGWVNRQYGLFERLGTNRQLRPGTPEMRCWPDSIRRVVRYGPSYIKCAARHAKRWFV